MEVQFFLRACLAMVQTSKLFGISEKELDLKPKLIVLYYQPCIQIKLCACQDDILIRFGIQKHHYFEIHFEVRRIQDQRINMQMRILEICTDIYPFG